MKKKQKHSLNMQGNSNNFPALPARDFFLLFFFFFCQKFQHWKLCFQLTFVKAISLPQQCLKVSWEMKLLTCNCYKSPWMFYFKKAETFHSDFYLKKKRVSLKWPFRMHCSAKISLKTFLNLLITFYWNWYAPIRHDDLGKMAFSELKSFQWTIFSL